MKTAWVQWVRMLALVLANTALLLTMATGKNTVRYTFIILIIRCDTAEWDTRLCWSERVSAESVSSVCGASSRGTWWNTACWLAIICVEEYLRSWPDLEWRFFLSLVESLIGSARWLVSKGPEMKITPHDLMIVTYCYMCFCFLCVF